MKKKPPPPHPWIEHVREQVDAVLALFEEDNALREEQYENPDPLKRRLRVSCNECTKPSCCKHRVSVTFAEALALYAWASEHERHLLEMIVARGAEAAQRPQLSEDAWFRRGQYCTFFVDGRCRVYAARPHACRTHYMKGNPSACARELMPPQTYAMDPDPKTRTELDRLDEDMRFFSLVGEWGVDELSQALYVIDRLKKMPRPERDPVDIDLDSV